MRTGKGQTSIPSVEAGATLRLQSYQTLTIWDGQKEAESVNGIIPQVDAKDSTIAPIVPNPGLHFCHSLVFHFLGTTSLVSF